MKTDRLFKAGLVAVAMACSAAAFAGEAKVTWQNPDKYTDIESGNQSQKSMLKSIDKSFSKEFSELAAKLPAGQHLNVTVTDLDLAGEVDPIPSRMMSEIRVLKDIYFPKMTFNYQIMNAGGVVVSEAEAVTLKDMQYLSGTRSTQSSDSFYYERKMLREWFNDDILPNVK